MNIPRKIKQPYDASITLTGVQPMDATLACQKTFSLPRSLQHYSNSQDMKATKVTINQGVDKENVMYILGGLPSDREKSKRLSFAATWMSL